MSVLERWVSWLAGAAAACAGYAVTQHRFTWGFQSDGAIRAATQTQVAISRMAEGVLHHCAPR
jgi:hypothetical protein